MTNREIVKEIAEKTGRDKSEVSHIIDALYKVVMQSLLRGEKVTIKNFAVFSLKDVKVRSNGEATQLDPVRNHVPKARFCDEFIKMVKVQVPVE